MEFFFNAIRGTQGGRDYFTATVPFKMLKRLMSFDTGDVLDRSQRAVDPARAKALAKYLVENDTSFVLPALTGIVDDPEMRFEEFGGDGSGIGRLHLSLDATIKLFDGQHRATGIMQALRDCPALQFNSITIQLFKGMTLEERQQAFSDINANAKAVSASLNMVYNKRDGALATIADQIKLVKAWDGKIDLERNIIGKNSDMMFSFRHAVQASRLLLGVSAKQKPDPMEVDQVRFWWDSVAVAVDWNYHEKAEHLNDHERKELHRRITNSVAFTAAGLLTLGRFGNMIRAKEHRSIPGWKVIEALQNINWDKSDEIWRDNLVDAKGNMVATTAAQTAAANAIFDRVLAYCQSF